MPVYRCSHLLTCEGFVDGAVAVRDGLVVAVKASRDVPRQRNECDHDLGGAIVMPGLVNAHTHLELSWMAADRPPGGDYVTWLRGLLERRENEDLATARAAAEQACDAAIARGTVAFGDICNDTWVADVWEGRPVCGVLFHELLGLERAEALVEEAQCRIDAREAPAGWRWTAVPHAPHTTSVDLMRRLAAAARLAGSPCSIHLAESPAERALLQHGDGPFRGLFESRGFLRHAATAPGCTPLERVEAAEMLGPGTLAVHSVDLDPEEILRLGGSGATVVTCPRSNAYLDVGTAPVPALLAAGASLALGTDSLATTADLDMFAEMAALRVAHPGVTPATIVHAATQGGADALGLGGALGSVEPGKRALLTVVPFAGDGDPFEYLCSAPTRAFPLARATDEIRA